MKVAFVLTCLYVLVNNDAVWSQGGFGNPFGQDDPVELARMLASNDHRTRRSAAWRLSMLGSGAQQALPALIAAVADKDPMIRADVAAALGRIGQCSADVSTPLAQLLRDPDVQVRRVAALSLRTIGVKSKVVTTGLVRALRDKDPVVRLRVAGSLIKMGYKDKRPVAVLICGLDEQDRELRLEAVHNFGSAGLHALPLVILSLRDKRPRVRRAAMSAIGSIELELFRLKIRFPRYTIRALLAALEHEDTELVEGAICILSDIADQARDAVPILTKLLTHRAWGVRYFAAMELRKFRQYALPAIPALYEAVNDSEERVRKEALATLQELRKYRAGR